MGANFSVITVEEGAVDLTCNSCKGKMANEVRDQLKVYHNPFSAHTAQPKIPDGKATHSIGFSTQSVFEIANTGTAPVGIILFPGKHMCFVSSGNILQNAFGSSRDGWSPSFEGSGSVDWSLLTDPPQSKDVRDPDSYAKWRLVSCGLQLKLLNSVEEDDGWWECIRLNEPIDHTRWNLTTDSSSIDRNKDGILTPGGYLLTLQNRTLSNEPSYSTGLLRDLNRIQFELHPTTDEHAFINCNKQLEMNTNDYVIDLSTAHEASFDRASAEVIELIETENDWQYDMVYIRIHPRTQTNEHPGTRLHCNLVSNQEIIYDSSERLARYQTKSYNVGPHMERHAEMRKANLSGANLIV